MVLRLRSAAVLTALIMACSTLAARQASPLSGRPLVEALRRGGYVLVMRHAQAPSALPTIATARAGNPTLERQLSEAGVAGATEMGRAMRALGIPIARVRVSPRFRAIETARYAAVGEPDVLESLGEGDGSMQNPGPILARALAALAAEVPVRGMNTLLVTHSGNIVGAFPEQPAPVAEGEIFVTRPDGRGGTTVVGRIKIDEWPALASAR